jgi:hypothetical protein
MAVNPYFKKDYSGEQDILEELTIELIKTMGRDMYYIPRNILNMDSLFGEGLRVNYTDGVPLEMYIDSVSGFDGQGDIASKFGIEIKDNINLTLSKKRFNQEISTKIPSITRPKEGDLIYFPLAKALFEINFVEHENPFYQFGKLYSYKLTCELFTYNQEEVQTGNTDIDAVVSENQQYVSVLSITQIGGQTLSLLVGETVYQVDGVTSGSATLANSTWRGMIALSGSTSTAYVRNSYGTLKTSATLQTIHGDTSNLIFYVNNSSVGNTLVIINKLDNSLLGENDSIYLETKTTNLIDFSENDPFSEGKYH